MPRLERPHFDDLPAAPQHIGAWACFLKVPCVLAIHAASRIALVLNGFTGGGVDLIGVACYARAFGKAMLLSVIILPVNDGAPFAAVLHYVALRVLPLHLRLLCTIRVLHVYCR